MLQTQTRLAIQRYPDLYQQPFNALARVLQAEDAKPALAAHAPLLFGANASLANLVYLRGVSGVGISLTQFSRPWTPNSVYLRFLPCAAECRVQGGAPPSYTVEPNSTLEINVQLWYVVLSLTDFLCFACCWNCCFAFEALSILHLRFCYVDHDSVMHICVSVTLTIIL